MTTTPDAAPAADTWDAMRASTFDLYVDGKPCEDLDVLLGVLGGAGKPAAYRRQLTQAWLESAASRPAPKALLEAARAFAGGHHDAAA